MSSNTTKGLEDALDRYFANFESTRALARDFIQERKHPVEILIMLCARLDALASDAAQDETRRKEAFTSFITNYGRKKALLEAVSIGDLYYELAYHRWALDGTISAPGRIHRFSRLDNPVIQLLEGAGLPLTLEDSDALFKTIMRILKHEYRAVPGQPLRKPRAAKRSVLAGLIVERVRRTRLKNIAGNLREAIQPLLRRKQIGTILYERFRSESIHGATIDLDSNRFFTEPSVYWTPLHSDYFGAFELAEFPAPFLLALLEDCIKFYRAALLARGQIPPAVHFHVFDDVLDALDLLDESLLPESGRVRLKID